MADTTNLDTALPPTRTRTVPIKLIIEAGLPLLFGAEGKTPTDIFISGDVAVPARVRKVLRSSTIHLEQRAALRAELLKAIPTKGHLQIWTTTVRDYIDHYSHSNIAQLRAELMQVDTVFENWLLVEKLHEYTRLAMRPMVLYVLDPDEQTALMDAQAAKAPTDRDQTSQDVNGESMQSTHADNEEPSVFDHTVAKGGSPITLAEASMSDNSNQSAGTHEALGKNTAPTPPLSPGHDPAPIAKMQSGNTFHTPPPSPENQRTRTPRKQSSKVAKSPSASRVTKNNRAGTQPSKRSPNSLDAATRLYESITWSWNENKQQLDLNLPKRQLQYAQEANDSSSASAPPSRGYTTITSGTAAGTCTSPWLVQGGSGGQYGISAGNDMAGDGTFKSPWLVQGGSGGYYGANGYY